MRTIYIVLLSVFYSAQLFSQQTQFRGLNRDGIYHEEGLLREWPEDGPKRVLLKEGLGTGFSQPLMHDGVIYITGRRDSVDILFSLDLKGNIFWQTVYGKSWDGSFPVTRNTPTIENDRIYVTGGSGEVSCIDAITGQILFQVNTHERFKGKFMGHGMSESLLIYGKSIISSPVGEETVLVALNKEDGSLIW